jgi:threonine efflux protein
VSIATCAVPGPNNFMLMRFGMKHGRGLAEAAGLGTTLACIVWCALASLGIAALLVAAPWLYKVLRVGGGLYLLYFAWMLWRAPTGLAAAQADGPGPAPGWWSAFWQGFAVNMANPKSVLYFASIFSAYVGPDTPMWMRLSAAAICIVTCQAWQTAMAWVFSTRRASAAYAKAQRPLDRTAGALMGLFGVTLILGLE